MYAGSPTETSGLTRSDHCQLQLLHHLNNNYCFLFGIAPQGRETWQCLPLLHKRNSSKVEHMLHLISNETLQKLGSTFYSPHTFFIQRVIKPWQWQPRKAMDAPLQEVFKARLNWVLGSLIWQMAGDWDWMGFKVHSNPINSMMPMILLFSKIMLPGIFLNDTPHHIQEQSCKSACA